MIRFCFSPSFKRQYASVMHHEVDSEHLRLWLRRRSPGTRSRTIPKWSTAPCIMSLVAMALQSYLAKVYAMGWPVAEGPQFQVK